MGKNKKKRNKAYAGADAAITKPIITRVSAADRSKVDQWWFDHKRTAKPILITSAVVIGAIILIYEIIRIATGA